MSTTKSAVEWLAKDRESLKQAKPGTVKWLRAAAYILLNPVTSDKEKLELLALRKGKVQSASGE